MHALLGSLGASLGYILPAINWKDSIFNFIGSENQIISVICTIVFIVSVITTMTSVKETPFELYDDEDEDEDSDDEGETGGEESETGGEESDNDKVSQTTSEAESEDEDEDDQPITVQMLFNSIVKVLKNKLIKLKITN
jgi:hypothetical protein